VGVKVPRNKSQINLAYYVTGETQGRVWPTAMLGKFKMAYICAPQRREDLGSGGMDARLQIPHKRKR
jgi:hypothetical protein